MEFGGGSGDILRDLLHLRSVVRGRFGTSRARRAATSCGISACPFRRRLAASTATQRHHGRPASASRCTWRVLLMRLSTAGQRALECARGPASTVTVSSSPSRTLAAAQGCSWSKCRDVAVFTALIGALSPVPRALTLRQMVEEDAGLVIWQRCTSAARSNTAVTASAAPSTHRASRGCVRVGARPRLWRFTGSSDEPVLESEGVLRAV